MVLFHAILTRRSTGPVRVLWRDAEKWTAGVWQAGFRDLIIAYIEHRSRAPVCFVAAIVPGWHRNVVTGWRDARYLRATAVPLLLPSVDYTKRSVVYVARSAAAKRRVTNELAFVG